MKGRRSEAVPSRSLRGSFDSGSSLAGTTRRKRVQKKNQIQIISLMIGETNETSPQHFTNRPLHDTHIHTHTHTHTRARARARALETHPECGRIQRRSRAPPPTQTRPPRWPAQTTTAFAASPVANGRPNRSDKGNKRDEWKQTLKIINFQDPTAIPCNTHRYSRSYRY